MVAEHVVTKSKSSDHHGLSCTFLSLKQNSFKTKQKRTAQAIVPATRLHCATRFAVQFLSLALLVVCDVNTLTLSSVAQSGSEICCNKCIGFKEFSIAAWLQFSVQSIKGAQLADKLHVNKNTTTLGL